jgi:hypothetical protein
MGDGVVELVLQWLGVEVLFHGFVEAVEFAAVCGWYGREDRYLTPSSPSIGGQVASGSSLVTANLSRCMAAVCSRRGEARSRWGAAPFSPEVVQQP